MAAIISGRVLLLEVVADSIGHIASYWHDLLPERRLRKERNVE